MATLLPTEQYVLLRTGKSMSDMQGDSTADVLQQAL
jgi:hypothetical protein